MQKKTGPVAGDVKVKEEANGDTESPKAKGKKAGGRETVKAEESDAEEEEEKSAPKGKGATRKRNSKAKEEATEMVNGEHDGGSAFNLASKKRKSASTNSPDNAHKKTRTEETTSGRRRSTRMSGKGA